MEIEPRIIPLRTMAQLWEKTILLNQQILIFFNYFIRRASFSDNIVNPIYTTKFVLVLKLKFPKNWPLGVFLESNFE